MSFCFDWEGIIAFNIILDMSSLQPLDSTQERDESNYLETTRVRTFPNPVFIDSVPFRARPHEVVSLAAIIGDKSTLGC